MVDPWLIFAGVDAALSATLKDADAGASLGPAAPSSRAESRISALEQRFERLSLITAALWSLLRERTGLTEAELLARVKEVDLADGHLDGKVRPPGPTTCPNCRRVFAARHLRCLYCGAERQAGSAFDATR